MAIGSVGIALGGSGRVRFWMGGCWGVARRGVSFSESRSGRM